MRHLLTAAAVLAAFNVNAECFTRSAMTNQMKARIERITDLHQTVVPTREGQKRCTVSFRAWINGDWHSGEGMSQTNPSIPDAQVCSQALHSGQTFLLQSIGGSNLTAEQEMVCSDEPKPQVRMVRVGDVIAESEVQPHALRRRPFVYNGSVCRWFTQMDSSHVVLDPSEGIMCRMTNDQWKVVDKF
jgi:hypothetical protein